MEICRILDSLYQRINASELLLPMEYLNNEEIDVVNDLNNLRKLKLMLAASRTELVLCNSIYECINKMKESEENYFVVLQYCTLVNPFLKQNVLEVFPVLKEKEVWTLLVNH